MTHGYGSSMHEPHCRDGSCSGCIPSRLDTFDCGHSCCDERDDPFHGHFLSPFDCPRCASKPEADGTSTSTPRPWTPDVREGTTTTLTVKRCCNGCGRTLGDANDAELDTAIAGQSLPDVRQECGCEPDRATQVFLAVAARMTRGKTEADATSTLPDPPQNRHAMTGQEADG